MNVPCTGPATHLCIHLFKLDNTLSRYNYHQLRFIDEEIEPQSSHDHTGTEGSNSETVTLEVTLLATVLCSKTDGLMVELRKCMHDQEPKNN